MPAVPKPFHVVEIFAGDAKLSKSMHYAEISTAMLDVNMGKPSWRRTRKAFDLLQPEGLAFLAGISNILAVPARVLLWGVCFATWVLETRTTNNNSYSCGSWFPGHCCCWSWFPGHCCCWSWFPERPSQASSVDGHEHRVWQLSMLDSISLQQFLSCQCPHQWSQPSHTMGLYRQSLFGRLRAAFLLSICRPQMTMTSSFPYSHLRMPWAWGRQRTGQPRNSYRNAVLGAVRMLLFGAASQHQTGALPRAGKGCCWLVIFDSGGLLGGLGTMPHCLPHLGKKWYPRFNLFCHCRDRWSLHLPRKRHICWSNSSEIGLLDRGKLRKSQREGCIVKTTTKKVKNGKVSYSGTRFLKGTQSATQFICWWGPFKSSWLSFRRGHTQFPSGWKFSAACLTCAEALRGHHMFQSLMLRRSLHRLS